MAAVIQMQNVAPIPTKTDPKDPLDDLVTGYPKLAGHMELEPEAAIFRRFGALNARNLLYLQCELCSLEKRLRQIEREDNRKSGRKSEYALDWYWLSQSADDGDTKQLELVHEMRKLLKEYNEALIQQSIIQNLKPPQKYDLKEIQVFLNKYSQVGKTTTLEGDDGMVWGAVTAPKAHETDLIALRPRRKEDAFSKLVAEHATKVLNIFGWERWKKRHRVHQVVTLSDQTIFQFTFWVLSILAPLIPIASIAVLYRVHLMSARLVIIGIFNLVMSVCLKVMTDAKRAEVFAVTCAFAAVQVVFVGTESKSCQPCQRG